MLGELHILLLSGSSHFPFPTCPTLTFYFSYPISTTMQPPHTCPWVRASARTPFPSNPSLQLCESPFLSYQELIVGNKMGLGTGLSTRMWPLYCSTLSKASWCGFSLQCSQGQCHTGPSGQFEHSQPFLGESRLMSMGTSHFILFGLWTEKHLGAVLFSRSITACVSIPPPSLPGPAMLFWRPHVPPHYAI